MKYSILLFLLLGLLVQGTLAVAAVIHVEKDGSGDFTVIQEAVDAAADGDVIMIGSGRFDDFVTDPQWGDFRVWTHGDKSLTFLGAGPEETIIGPEVYDGLYRGWGIYCSPGSVTIRIEGIRFENLDRAGAVLHCDNVELENCVFEKCHDVFVTFGEESATITNCQFYNSLESYTEAMFCRARHVEVSGVLVQNCRRGLMCDFYGTNDISVTNSVFDGGGVGLGGIFFDNCGGVVTDCSFIDLGSVGFSCTQGGNISFQNNVFEGINGIFGLIGKAIAMDGGDSFFATGNVFSSTDICFKLDAPFDTFEVHNNHIFRNESDEGHFVITNDDWNYWELHWDFTNNYWGTTDPDEVSQWIIDGYDSDEVTMYVDFLPMAGGPVSTESISLDGLKAMFR